MCLAVQLSTVRIYPSQSVPSPQVTLKLDVNTLDLTELDLTRPETLMRAAIDPIEPGLCRRLIRTRCTE